MYGRLHPGLPIDRSSMLDDFFGAEHKTVNRAALSFLRGEWNIERSAYLRCILEPSFSALWMDAPDQGLKSHVCILSSPLQVPYTPFPYLCPTQPSALSPPCFGCLGVSNSLTE